jgi:hypothetical protein
MSSRPPPPSTHRDSDAPPPRMGGDRRRLGAALLVFELHDMRALMALAGLALVGGALGLAAMWPALARIEAIAALLLLPPLAVVLALRWTLVERGCLRAVALGVGAASALAAFGTAIAIVHPAGPFESFWLRTDAPEQTVGSAFEPRQVTLTVRGTLQGDGGAVRLGVGRDGKETVVRLAFDTDSIRDRRSFGLGEPVQQRLAAVPAPGEGPLRVRLIEAPASLDAGVHVVVSPAGVLERYAVPMAGVLGVAGLAVQSWAERRRARSWLLVGSWAALAFAIQAPGAWDASSPGWSAAGVLLFAALAGGCSAAAVSYVVAKLHERAGQGPAAEA